MKKLQVFLVLGGILYLAIVCISFQFTPPKIRIFGPPTNTPANGCPTGTHVANGWYCDFQKSVLPTTNGVSIIVNANDIDVGVNAPDFSGWSTVDLKFQPYTGVGINITNISNVGNVSTATMAASSPGKWESGDWICVAGNSVTDYNACWLLTGATYVANKLSTVTWTQNSPIATGNNGTMANACGASLLQGAQKCTIVPIIRHNQASGPVINPTYMFTQPWANSSCPSWSSAKHVLLRECVTVGGQFFHNTTIGSDGSATTAGVQPTFNVTPGSTTTDGTAHWFNDGANAFPQEVIIGNGYVSDGNGPPNTAWFPNTTGGVNININSTNCGAGGNVACTLATVSGGFPVSNESPWLNWYNIINAGTDGNGVQGVIGHFANAAYASQIPYIRIGGWNGGEWFGWFKATIINVNVFNLSYAQYQGMYVDYVMFRTLQQNVATYLAFAPAFKLQSALNPYAGCTADSHCQDFFNEEALKISQANTGYGIGNNGLQVSDLTFYQAGNTNSTNGGNWPSVFNQYCLFSNNNLTTANPCELQTFAASCPINQVSGQCSAAEITNGSLAILLPFSAQHGASSIELYASDGLCAWDSFYTTANSNTTNPTFDDCQRDNYQTYWTNTAAGAINFTSIQKGSTVTNGTTVMQ